MYRALSTAASLLTHIIDMNGKCGDECEIKPSLFPTACTDGFPYLWFKDIL